MEESIKLEPTTGLNILPHWLAQPYFRIQPTSTETVAKESKRMHGSDAGHAAYSNDKRGGDNERQRESRQEDSKRVKLTTDSAVVLLPL